MLKTNDLKANITERDTIMEEKRLAAMDTSDISVLSHEITYRRYLLNKGKVKELFQNISIPEYIALHSIAKRSDESSIYGQKTYLKDISAKMELSMRQTSKMIVELRDRGLLTWGKIAYFTEKQVMEW